MRMFGITLTKPSAAGLFMALLMGIAGLLAGRIFQSMMGGTTAEVISLACTAFVVGLLSACGAYFHKAGVRGIVLSVVFGIFAGVLGLAASSMISTYHPPGI